VLLGSNAKIYEPLVRNMYPACPPVLGHGDAALQLSLVRLLRLVDILQHKMSTQTNSRLLCVLIVPRLVLLNHHCSFC